MTYNELEAQILSEFQQDFTEYHKGGPLPGGDVQESEWVVQACVEDLQEFLRAALREVRRNTLHEIEHSLESLKKDLLLNWKPLQVLRITFPDGSCRYVNCAAGDSAHELIASVIDEERGRFPKGTEATVEVVNRRAVDAAAE